MSEENPLSTPLSQGLSELWGNIFQRSAKNRDKVDPWLCYQQCVHNIDPDGVNVNSLLLIQGDDSVDLERGKDKDFPITNEFAQHLGLSLKLLLELRLEFRHLTEITMTCPCHAPRSHHKFHTKELKVLCPSRDAHKRVENQIGLLKTQIKILEKKRDAAFFSYYRRKRDAEIQEIHQRLSLLNESESFTIEETYTSEAFKMNVDHVKDVVSSWQSKRVKNGSPSYLKNVRAVVCSNPIHDAPYIFPINSKLRCKCVSINRRHYPCWVIGTIKNDNSSIGKRCMWFCFILIGFLVTFLVWVLELILVLAVICTKETCSATSEAIVSIPATVRALEGHQPTQEEMMAAALVADPDMNWAKG